MSLGKDDVAIYRDEENQRRAGWDGELGRNQKFDF